MLLVFGIIFIALAAITLLAETQYVGTARVYVYHSATKSALLSRLSLDSSAQTATSLTDSERATYEELGIVMPVVTPLIDELHLTRKRKSLQILEYIPFVRPILDHFLPHFGRRAMTYEELTNKSLVHILFPRPYLKAAMMEDADILEFTTSAESMELANALANAAARSFAARETAMRQEECRALAESARGELPKAKAAYEEVLAEQRRMRQQQKAVDLDHEAQQLVDRFYTLTADRDANRLDLIKSQGMLASVRAQMAKRPEFRKTSETTQRSSLIDSVKQTMSDLYIDLASAKSRMTSEHPEVKEIENKIAEAKRIIKGEAYKIYGSETVSTDPTFSYLNERVAEYAATLAGYESQDTAFNTLIGQVEQNIQAFPERSAAVTLATGRVEGALTYLTNVNQLYAQALAGTRLDLSLAHLVEPAVTPGKIDDYMRPKLSLMLAIGAALGVFLALSAALIAAYVDVTAGDPKAAAQAGAVALPSVPGRPGPGRDQGFRRLRDALFPAGAAGPKTIVLAAPDTDEAAAAALSLGLATALARSGRRTLLVDADIRRPNLYRLAGLPLGPGLAEVLTDAAGIEAVILPGPEAGLSVLPAGAGTISPADADRALDGPGLARILARLAEEFDVVVICAAPLGRTGDALGLARLAEVAVLTVTLFRTPTTVLTEAVAELRAATGREPAAVFDGVPGDDRSPREEWAALRQRLRRLRPARRGFAPPGPPYRGA